MECSVMVVLTPHGASRHLPWKERTERTEIKNKSTKGKGVGDRRVGQSLHVNAPSPSDNQSSAQLKPRLDESG